MFQVVVGWVYGVEFELVGELEVVVGVVGFDFYGFIIGLQGNKFKSIY